MDTIVTIDQVSKEVKAKISKLGTASLLKKYHNGDFEGQELIAAEFFLLKREAIKPEDVQSTKSVETTQTTTFGRHRSEMTEQEVADADARVAATVAENKAKNVGKPVETMSEKLSKAEKKIEKVVKKEKVQPNPVMKLTEQEFKLFESIKKNYVKNVKADTDTANNISLTILGKSFESLREFKGVLGSLSKKKIISYDQDNVQLIDNGLDMINEKLEYKQKSKHEQNFFKKVRTTVNIEGKDLEKSAYVRMLLRKNNHISCAELNDALAKVGFSKLYHSELQRCKSQLGIVSDKNKD